MENKVISAKQAGMMCVILLLANKILLLPSLIFEDIGADGIFVVILLLFLDLLVLGAFYLLKSRFPDFSFSQILEKYLGKIVTKIIYIFLLVFFLFKAILTYSVSYIFLKQQVYQDDFELLALICILPIVNHAVFVSLRTFSRTIEMFFYLIVVGIVLCLFISINNDLGLPLFFQTSPAKYFGSTLHHIFAFGDYLFLFLIIDKIKFKEGEGRKILKFALFGIVLLLAIYASFYSIFRITAFMHNNALSDIISVSVQYSSVGRLDIISMLTIMFLTYFQLEIFIFAFCNSFESIFPKLNRIHALIAFDISFLLLNFSLLGQYDMFFSSTENYLPYLAIVVNYILPIILTFVSLKFGKRRKYEKIF